MISGVIPVAGRGSRALPKTSGAGMMVAALRTGQTVIEIPVEYHPRAGGESKHSASYPRIALTTLRMLRTVLCHRLGWR